VRTHALAAASKRRRLSDIDFLAQMFLILIVGRVIVHVNCKRRDALRAVTRRSNHRGISVTQRKHGYRKCGHACQQE
jgi:hypothetical protein